MNAQAEKVYERHDGKENWPDDRHAEVWRLGKSGYVTLKSAYDTFTVAQYHTDDESAIEDANSHIEATA